MTTMTQDRGEALQRRRPSVFTTRFSFKPREFPEALEYAKAIEKSYWTHDHFIVPWQRDVQDFHIKLSAGERQVITRTLLAISQVEVKVKRFWANLYKTFPKQEFEAVGVCFADCERRHAETYAHLLEMLGLNDAFNGLLQVPAIKGRVDYMEKHMANGGGPEDPERYTTTLALFSLFVENVSLFSQFAIIKSFFKHRGLMRGIDNAVQATQKEELVHGLFGIYLINLIREEHPEWFGESFFTKLTHATAQSYKAELGILTWIFEGVELDFLPLSDLEGFLQHRFNESLTPIGAEPFFPHAKPCESLRWFEEEIHAASAVDKFHKRATAYTRGRISADELF